MNHETQVQTPGEELARKTLGDALAKADAYCTFETQRIWLQNQSRIAALRADLARLQDEEHRLAERLHRALPPGDARERRRKAVYYWLVTFALTVAGFFFSLLAFDPYRLGWKSYLYCAGIALVSPFCVEKFLETWASPKLFKVLATIACVAALASLVLLALVRGDVLAQQIRGVAPIVVSGGETPAAAQPQTNFYDETLILLRLLMALLALAMEIGAGLALYEARRLGASSGEDPAHVNQDLKAIQQEMVAKLEDLRHCENQAAIFQNEFWRDFYRALSDGISRNALVKVSVLVLAALLFLPLNAKTADNLNLVIALDLTRSVAVASPGQRQEFQKNMEAAGRLLAELPADTRVTLVGITDQSFGEPLLLLEARIPEDEGYFHERLAAARRTLAEAWRERAKNLNPQFTHTDIFGTLLLASQIFQNAPKGRDVLVIFSDMRENAGGSNFEKLRDVRLSQARSAQARALTNLYGVEVHVLGADNAGKSMGYWTALRDFWSEYFKATGATLKTYSVLRDSPKLQR